MQTFLWVIASHEIKILKVISFNATKVSIVFKL